ncbi:MAG: AAA family ATPase [Christensenellaceae bacterium]|nr:AAA family ATPase [Christensenellaceae bacterium]
MNENKLYLFFDKIQDVELWYSALNSFAVDFNCDIYISGFNSKMLSGELAAYIAEGSPFLHLPVYFRRNKEICRAVRKNFICETLDNPTALSHFAINYNLLDLCITKCYNHTQL